MSSTGHDAFRAAVGDAVHAPSIFNTQPWRWHVGPEGLHLTGDATRRLPVVDPDATLLLLSCGAALHHARVSLAAQGWAVRVDRLPCRERPGADGPYGCEDVLARIVLLGRVQPDPVAIALRAAIPRRRTDRRPFGDEPVPASALAALIDAARAQVTRVHRVRLDQMPMLAVAVAGAQDSERADPRYRIELIQWTNRPEWSNDGVPPGTAVRRVPRRVPVRDFTPVSAAGRVSNMADEQSLAVAPGGDRGAAYLILHGPGERALDWLRAGEALSSVLLTAAQAGLATAPFTDVLEVDHPRDLVRGLLPGLSHPYVLVRCGYPGSDQPLPAVPRREVDEVLHEVAAGERPVSGRIAGRSA